MRVILFYICCINFISAQNDSFLDNKKEIISGVNFSGFLGVNAGFSSSIKKKKRYYRIDMQYCRRFYNSTKSYEPKDNFWYENLSVKSIVLNNMFSYRFYKNQDFRFYFETGLYFGINLWQDKKGQTKGYYQLISENFNKTSYFVPNDIGLHFACGIRPTNYFIIKPELRFSILSFDKLFEESSFLYEMILNSKLSLNLNLSYQF